MKIRFKLILFAVALLCSSTLFGETTLVLNNLDIATNNLPERPFAIIIHERYGEPESYSQTAKNLVECDFNPFMHAIHHSFASHRPIRISPDHIWLVLAQGFAAHVNQNSAELRDKFVRHTGKLTLEVRRDAFKKGKMENPWEEVFPEFCKQISEHVDKDAVNSVTAKFSTTTPAEQAAFQITLMDAMQDYFSYKVSTFCGIPSIILEGTTQDWKELKERSKQFEKYDLKWWTDELDPILDEFINASEGRVNTAFWNSMYKDQGQSGGPFVTGWISKLFPYLVGDHGKRFKLNPAFNTKNIEETQISLGSFPQGISKAPFTWKYYYKKYEMVFLAGFVGISQDHETKTVRPEIGWVILENPEKRGFLRRIFSSKK
jgi:hypothetical protein